MNEGATYRVSVGIPWWGQDAAEDSGPVREPCEIVEATTGWIALVTDDVEAPPRNALIEEVPPGTECP